MKSYNNLNIILNKEWPRSGHIYIAKNVKKYDSEGVEPFDY